MKNILLKIWRLLKKPVYWISSPWRKLPDFIIIGVQKGGTSSLFSYLEQHPQLRLSREKEVHYFDLNYWKPYFVYKSYFPIKSNKYLTGEASPYYIFHPKVPQRIKQHLPNTKLILMLRDPVERALSHYNMEFRKGKEDIETFNQAINIEQERLEGERNKIISGGNSYNSFSHQTYSYLSRGKYYEQLAWWFEYFPRDQFCIIKSEDFFINPKETLKQIYDFLGIDTKYPDNLSPQNVGHYPKELDEQILEYCRNYFQEDSIRLKELIGEDFHWEVN